MRVDDVPPPHVLLVDDQADIREPLAAYLERCGIRATAAVDAADMRRRLSRAAFDLILLDVMLPDEDGLSLCRHVADSIGTPVILLTAMASPRDRVAGLDTGADDYVVKPFDPPELVARIRSVLRRQARADGAAGRRTDHRFAFDGWSIDTARRTLLDPAGAPVALSDREFDLLATLVSHPHQVLSRERLLDLTQRDNLEAIDRSIDTQISRLRRKLDAGKRRPPLIKTAWGDGYRFVADVRSLGP